MCYNDCVRIVKINAYGKLNLTLDVLGKTGNFHEIDSLVTTVDLSDKVRVSARKDGKIHVTMRGMGSEEIFPEENSAWRAADLYQRTFETPGVDILIDKNIPMRAGLGGSSVDAAAVLRGMQKLYGESAEKIAPQLGSDVPALLHGGLVRMRGRGEKITPIPSNLKLYFLLLVPKNGVDTGKCYQKSDALPPCAPCTESALKKLSIGDLEGAAKCFQNGLFPAACELEPQVKLAFDELTDFSPWGVNMTGSGSGVYAVFETEELCAWAKSRYRGKFGCYTLRMQQEKQKGE